MKFIAVVKEAIRARFISPIVIFRYSTDVGDCHFQ